MIGKIASWNDVTVENIYAFDAWLHTLTKPQNMTDRLNGVEPEKIKRWWGVYNYHKRLKALLNRALKIGSIDNNPCTSGARVNLNEATNAIRNI